ncbi:unnamed protein product [Ceutorhynchus assimilis]|uniref:Uncharacterized protein n=1 Tax=Ceutorhynchus assimilis TaxID=467358 RepID=A0A9N9N1A7_9CUCU|nr:unnamed protein product [Ceutorhynchus assimilis]
MSRKVEKSIMPEGEYGSENHLVTSTNNMGEDIIEIEESFDPHSITGILNVCKQKLLKPYMRFLSLMGLRPIIDDTNLRFMGKTLNLFYNLQVILFLVTGYLLQYMSCFRRDRGFGSMNSNLTASKLQMEALYEKTCSASMASCFIIPSLLHFTGYLYALIIFRRNDDDQLPVLIERVFLISSHVPNMQVNQRHIVKTLWVFMISSFIWMIASMALVNYMMAEEDISFRWLENGPYWAQFSLKILLVVCILWHDIVQASVISNYCLQVQLLRTYVQFIREKLLQTSIRPLEWIRDVEEFRKLLVYLNEEVAPAVCILGLVNWVYAVSGTVWLLAVRDDSVPLYTAANLLNFFLWWFIAAVPFVQAARLTMACENVKTAGQEVRTRPYAHQDTPVQELNSILLYTISLKMYAKLYNLPIRGRQIGIIFAILCVVFLVLAQNYRISTSP